MIKGDQHVGLDEIRPAVYPEAIGNDTFSSRQQKRAAETALRKPNGLSSELLRRLSDSRSLETNSIIRSPFLVGDLPRKQVC